MTLRAFIIGLLSVAVLCSVVYFNDYVLRQTPLIGSHVPVGVYGTALLFLITVNPLLHRFRPGWALTAPELALILSMTGVACAIPGAGLMKQFGPTLMMPHHHLKTLPGWHEYEVLNLVPKHLLADPGENQEALGGFIQGLERPAKPFSLSDIPWSSWTSALAFWIPLILVLWVALLTLSFIFHKQWSENEQVAYPIIHIINSLLPGADGKISPVIRNRYFLIGAGLVFLIHINNFAVTQFPDLIEIKIRIDLRKLLQVFPREFEEGGGMGGLLNFRMHFLVIGIAYFLSRDVGLSLAVGPVLYGFVGGILGIYGISVRGTGIYEYNFFLVFGAYLGLFVAILYAGRHFYAQVVHNAFLGSRTKRANSPEPIWAARIFLASVLIFILLLASTGLDWQLAVIYTSILFITFTVMSRILAETGFFTLQPPGSEAGILLGIFGAQRLGPQVIAQMGLFTSVLRLFPREALMPYIVNGLKLLENRRVALGKGALCFGAALIFGLMVALPVTFYWQYARGTEVMHSSALGSHSRIPFDYALQVRQWLEAQGLLAGAENLQGWARFLPLSPSPSHMFSLFLAFSLVLLFAWIRLRYPRFPLHPVLFAIWIAGASMRVALSFFLGFLIRELILKFGGHSAYERARPLMIGLASGELLAAAILCLFGFAQYLITGTGPRYYSILPW